MPLLGEVTTSVVQVNTELARVDTIATNVEEISSNARALTSLFSATLAAHRSSRSPRSPTGCAGRISGQREQDVRKRVKSEMKAENARRARGAQRRPK